LDANLENGYYGQITASNFTGDLWRWNEFKFVKAKGLHDATRSPLLSYYDDFISQLTEEDAKQMMADLLEELGIEKMQLISFEANEITNGLKEDEAYLSSFYGIFERAYYGFSIKSDISMRECAVAYSDRPFYKTELVKIRIAYDEIVEFIWESPAREISIEESNAELLLFDEIMDVFQENMMQIYDAEKISRDAPKNDGHEEYVNTIEKGFISINRIELCMERIPVEGDENLYKMIPVWKFFGNETLKIKGLEDYTTIMPDNEHNYLTINAADGSIINRELGY
jgi:hypothetical protein